jgi:transcriptional regulator with XRE-family HTH domain
MSRPTIVDVAKTAGVSKATVSRVLSGNAEYMRPQTRQQVLNARRGQYTLTWSLKLPKPPPMRWPSS